MKQASFFDSKSDFSKSRISYGGETKGRRKAFRPLDRKRPLHVVLKSSHAKGKLSLLAKKLEVADAVETRAQKYRVKIHGFENMGNHLHMMLSFKSRKEMQDFLRSVTSKIAQLITKAKRANAFGKRFWDALAFTRIITSRRDFASTKNYLAKNQIERDFGAEVRKCVELDEELKRDMRKTGKSAEEVLEGWFKRSRRS